MTPSPKIAAPGFPVHTRPRVWFITSASSPIGLAIAQEVLKHGDFVLAGDDTNLSAPENAPCQEAWASFLVHAEDQGWDERLELIEIEPRNLGQCQAAIARAVNVFGRLDILFCCSSEAVIGTVEELGVSQATRTLARSQFDTNFFGPINIIKAVLPTMRAKHSGHIIVQACITGHLGTPGLGIYCSSGWALEGFCDSLAYEIAPFNIRTTIIQTHLEVSVLTNKISATPVLPYYTPDTNPAPLCRTIIGGLLERIDNRDSTTIGKDGQSRLSSGDAVSLYPKLPASMSSAMLAETINAVTAIGGHGNPPTRHIVGHEAVASVKQKLKTVSEELEDFIDVSAAVDIDGERSTSPEPRTNYVH